MFPIELLFRISKHLSDHDVKNWVLSDCRIPQIFNEILVEVVYNPKDDKCWLLSKILKNQKLLKSCLIRNTFVDLQLAFKVAVNVGDLNACSFIIAMGADPSFCSNREFKTACEKGFDRIVSLLLGDSRVDPCEYTVLAPIVLASKNGHLGVVRILSADERMDVGVNSNAAIRFAAERGHIAVVQELLKSANADPSVFSSYALRAAVKNNHMEVVRALLEDGRVDPTADSNYCLKICTESGNTEMKDLILGALEG